MWVVCKHGRMICMGLHEPEGTTSFPFVQVIMPWIGVRKHISSFFSLSPWENFLSQGDDLCPLTGSQGRLPSGSRIVLRHRGSVEDVPIGRAQRSFVGCACKSGHRGVI